MSRKDSKERMAELMDAALEEAKVNGFSNLERRKIASRCGVAEPLVNHYLGTLTQLKNKVMRTAVKQGILPIIAEGLAIKNPHAMKASEELKEKARQTI